MKNIKSLTFGLAIKVNREKIGLTQKELSKRAHIDVTQLCKIEHGCNSTTLDTLCKILDALDLTLQIVPQDKLPF